MNFIKTVNGDLLLQIARLYHHLIQDNKHLPAQVRLVGPHLLELI
jgi:hypothetical protein